VGRKSNTPRRKRFKRPARLKSARNWIKEYNGKNIVKGYARWFGVDLMCAIRELKIMGVIIPEALENQIIASYKQRIEQIHKAREKKKADELMCIDQDDHFAFIAGYTSAGFPYGITYDELEEIEWEHGLYLHELEEIFFREEQENKAREEWYFMMDEWRTVKMGIEDFGWEEEDNDQLLINKIKNP
jgi:hypothetical protein